MAQPSTTPEWATTGTKVTPASAKQSQGWLTGEKVPAQWLNWWMNLVYLWILYLKNLSSEAITWTAAHVFNIAITAPGFTYLSPGKTGTVFLAAEDFVTSWAGSGTGASRYNQGDAQGVWLSSTANAGLLGARVRVPPGAKFSNVKLLVENESGVNLNVGVGMQLVDATHATNDPTKTLITASAGTTAVTVASTVTDPAWVTCALAGPVAVAPFTAPVNGWIEVRITIPITTVNSVLQFYALRIDYVEQPNLVSY